MKREILEFKHPESIRDLENLSRGDLVNINPVFGVKGNRRALAVYIEKMNYEYKFIQRVGERIEVISIDEDSAFKENARGYFEGISQNNKKYSFEEYDALLTNRFL